MGIYEECTRARWREAIARIATQIDDLKARIDTESRTLYTKLSTEIAVLQADLRNLQVEVSATGPDYYVRQIAEQIEELRAKGDAAYDMLQTSMATQLDPADAEIRTLEAVAATASEDAKVTLQARIDELKAARLSARALNHADNWPRYTGDIQP